MAAKRYRSSDEASNICGRISETLPVTKKANLQRCFKIQRPRAVADPGWGIWANAPPSRSRYSNRAVNYSNKAVTMFMRQCSLPMKLQIGFYFT